MELEHITDTIFKKRSSNEKNRNQINMRNNRETVEAKAKSRLDQKIIEDMKELGITLGDQKKT